MARWNIRRALEVAALLRERWPDRWRHLTHSLGLDETEFARWRTVAETILTGWNSQTGLFEQFAGFFALEEIDLAGYAGRSVPMDVVLGRERTQRSKVVKQADVVALFGLLPEEFPGDSGRANFCYYEPRCSHGSSLSAAMHGLVAARLGELGPRIAVFPACGGNRSGRYPHDDRWGATHGGSRRHVANRRLGLCRVFIAERRDRLQSQTARTLDGLEIWNSVAWPPSQD